LFQMIGQMLQLQGTLQFIPPKNHVYIRIGFTELYSNLTLKNSYGDIRLGQRVGRR